MRIWILLLVSLPLSQFYFLSLSKPVCIPASKSFILSRDTYLSALTCRPMLANPQLASCPAKERWSLGQNPARESRSLLWFTLLMSHFDLTLSSTSPDSWLLDFSLTVQLRSLVSLYVCSQSTYPTLAYSYSLVETLEPVARVWNPSSAHSLAVQFWANYSTCMCLSFLAVKQDNERTWLIWSWWRLNELRYLKGYERCLAHPKCYPNVYEHYGYCYYYLALYMLFNFLSCYSALL